MKNIIKRLCFIYTKYITGEEQNNQMFMFITLLYVKKETVFFY